MSYNDIKLRPTDTQFSLYIRQKAGWKCEKCGRVCRDEAGIEIYYRLEASHYIGRRSETTRFDEENVHALCFTCHKRMGGYRPDGQGEYDLWLKELFGEERWKALVVRGHQPGKRDDAMQTIINKQLINSLGNQL